MKERAPAFQFYPRQFAADEHVMAMDLDTVGAHILLMCAAAASPEGYRIPIDERAIRTRLRNPSDEAWERIKSQLIAGPWKISCDGQWWEQAGLRRTLEKQRAFSESQRQRVNSRYTRARAGTPPEVHPAATGEATGDLPESYSSSSSSSSKKNATSEAEVSDPIPFSSTHKQGHKPSEAGLRLAQLLRRMILQNNPSAKLTDRQETKWALDADRMLRLDSRTEQEIAGLIVWSQEDEFWFKNILSMSKVRDKFDRLTLERQSQQKKDEESERSESGDARPRRPKWTGLMDSDEGELKK